MGMSVQLYQPHTHHPYFQGLDGLICGIFLVTLKTCKPSRAAGQMWLGWTLDGSWQLIDKNL